MFLSPLIRHLHSTKKLSRKVNTQLKQNTVGRLFAVIMVAGKQRKITNEDIIVLDKPIEAQTGEKILLNKVLLVGGSDFTLIGRPLLKPNMVKVEATVIEKPLSHPIVMFWYRRRENFRFFKLRKINYTYLRINDIKLFELPA
ncbi:hypothetical protein HELRODRAFT_161850 [Helobdella robusta]|uniref:Large ribosomal subunit protein bL21m n=1 Tax=Helobdella robusta TaxID=6412 RepID=T1ERY8_HELRO|nr:hypothetical protein HELRODRAFT_161850 [Helobdella robusta]ESO02568.1 hypothetical protein HELRODRAFT_161850 [Helobdella robusta]